MRLRPFETRNSAASNADPVPFRNDGILNSNPSRPYGFVATFWTKLKGASGPQRNDSPASHARSRRYTTWAKALGSFALAGSLVTASFTTPATAAAACTPSTSTTSGVTTLTFTNVGSACDWTIPTGITQFSVLVVGGGGGGGADAGGGGGGGGLISATVDVSASTNRTAQITVGSGGNPVKHSNGQSGSNGSSSQFSFTDEMTNNLTLQANGGSRGTAAGSTTTVSGGAGGTTLASNSSTLVSYTTIQSIQGGTGGGGSPGGYNTASNGIAGTGGTASATLFGGSYSGGGGGGPSLLNGFNGARGDGVRGGGSSAGLWSATYGGAQFFADAGMNYRGGGGGAGAAHGTTNSYTADNGGPYYMRDGKSGGSGVVKIRYSITYQIQFDSGSQSASSNQIQYKTHGENLALPDSSTANTWFTRAGYSVVGWSTTDGGSVTQAFGSSYTADAAATFYPVWASNLLLALDATDTHSFSSGTSITNLGTTGASNNGTMSPGIAVTNQAFDFPDNNSSDYIDLAGTLSSDLLQDGYTFDIYAAVPSSGAVWDRLIGFAVDDGSGTPGVAGRQLTISRDSSDLSNGNRLTLHVWNGDRTGEDYAWCRTDAAAFDGTMKRYTVVGTSTGCQIFIDDVEVAATETTVDKNFIPPSGSTWDNLYIGKSNHANDLFEGEIRSVRLFSSVLTPAQIDLIDSGDLTYTTVNLNADGGSLNSTPSSLVTSGTLALPSSGPTRAGYTFAGWAESSGDSNLNGSLTPSSNPDTVYALWAAEASSPPTGLVLTSGDTSVDMSWSAPTSVGAAISDYKIEYQLRGAGSWTTFNDGVSSATSATVTGLTTGKIYNFRVSAINAGGTSSPSDVRTTITLAGLLSLLDASDSNSYSGTGNTWFDITGNGNSVTAINSPTFNGAGGYFDLNGSSQYFTYGTSAEAIQKFYFAGTNPYTIVTFVSPDDLAASPARETLFARWNGTVGGSYMLEVNQDGFNAQREVSPWRSAQFGEAVNGGKSFAIHTYDGTDALVYVDGELAGSQAFGAVTDRPNVESMLGARKQSNSPIDHFDGKFFAAAIFDESITAVQALALTQAFDTAPSAPVIDSIASSSGTLSVQFTAGQNDGTAIKIYQYSTDGGATWRDRSTGTTASPLVITTTSATNSALVDGSSYNVVIRAKNTLDGAASNQVAGTPLDLALTPAFATPTATSDGFTVQVSNFDGNYSWGVTTSAGSASVNGSGLITVTGLSPAQSATVTVNTSRSGFSSGSSTVTGSAAQTVTVTFKSNFVGGPSDTTQNLSAGITANLTSNSFTRNGYTFSGWHTNAIGSGGSDFSDGQSVSITADLDLYAQWTASTNTVVWDSNGGSSLANSSFNTGGTLSKPTDPTKTDKIFGGWSTSETLNQGDLVNRITSWPYSPSQTSGFTLYAIWLSVAPPQNVAAATGPASVLVSWDAPDTALTEVPTGYRVEYSTTGKANGTWNLASGSIAASARSFAITGLTPNTSYYVRVAALYNGSIGAYGYPWTKLYEVTSPVRDSSKNIVYAAGFGLGSGDAADLNQSASFSRVRYLMSATIDGQADWADVDFDTAFTHDRLAISQNLDSVAVARVPSVTSPNDFAIQGDVSDMRVQSSEASVDEGIGFSARLEIWPWNYGKEVTASLPGGSSQNYDYNDNTVQNDTDHGSFQVHNLDGTPQTVLAWNRHREGGSPSVGFGPLSPNNPDWTFDDRVVSAFNLEIYANIPVAAGANSYTVTYEYNGADGGTRPQDATYDLDLAVALTLPAPTKSTLLFGGWYSDSSLQTFVGYAGDTFTPTADTKLYARWTNLLINLDGSNGDSLADGGSTWTSVLPGASNAVGTKTGNASYFSSGSIEGFQFDNSGDAVVFPTNTGNTSGEMTLEMWIQPSSLRDGWNLLASKWFDDRGNGSTGTYQWHLAIKKEASNPLRLNAYTSSNGTSYALANAYGDFEFSSTDTKWYLVGFTIDESNNLQFYVNGQRDGAPHAGATNSPRASQLWIGDARDGTGFAGKVSEFRIYNNARTANEIQSGFAAKATTYGLASIELNKGDLGTGASVMGYKYDGDGYTLPDSAAANGYFTRANYKVVGWSVNADGSTTDYQLGGSYTNNANVTLYPVWGTTSVEALGDTWVQSGSSANSNFGASEYLLFKNASNSITNSYNRVSYAEFAFDPDAVWSGAALEVYVTGNADGSQNNGYNISYTTFNIDVYGANDASWEEGTLTFTGARTSTQGWGLNTSTWPWNPKSATYLGTISIPTSSATVGQKFSLATAALEDFLNADADGAVTIYMRRSDTDNQANLSFASSENSTYAGPTLVLAGSGYEYRIAYDINGGSGSVPASGTYTQGQSGSYTIAATTGITAPVNKTLVGWNTKADGTGQDYAAGDSYSTTRSVTLYAKYVDNPVVTFDSNFIGGPSVITQRVGYDSATSLRKNTFIRPGYSFAGWNENLDGTSGTNYADEAQLTTTSAVTLYAKWTAQSVTVTYDRGLATAGAPSKTTESYTIDTAGGLTLATQNTMDLAGHTFGGWTTVNGDAITAKTDGYNPTTSVTLYALWTPVNYTASYLTTGADSGSAPTDGTNYNIGQKVTVRGNTGPMVKAGYTFAGWTVQGGDGTVLGSGDQIEFGAANIVLVPSWTANTYTVTFNKNGASGTTPAAETFTVDQDTNVPLPSIGDMDKVGYTFTGWATSANGTGQTGTYVPSQSVTLFAIWELKTINIDYVAGTAGGQDVSGLLSLMPADITGTKKYGQSLTIASVDSTVTVGGTQYKFFGWKDSSGVVYEPGQTITLGPSDYTLTAQWVELYAVRYALNGGSGQPLYDADDCLETGYKCTLNQPITLHGAPTRDGYTFDGWLDSSGALHAAGAGLTVSGTNYLLYAQWTAIDYQMAFDENGGSGSASTLTGKHVGDVVTLPAAPGTKTGYNFTGWSDGSATYGSQTLYTMGAANVDFTAVWTPKVFVIAYDWNGGSSASVAPYSYTYGTGPLPLPSGASASRDGYDFVGWSETAVGTAVSAGYAPSTSRTLYAVWTPGNYSIQLNGRGSQTSLAARSVALGGTLALPTASRDGFAFDGWYSDANFTKFVGKAGDDFSPSKNLTLHAKWTQLSLAGVNTGALINLDSLTMAGGSERGTFGSHAKSGTGYTLSIPAGALPDGTNVNVSIVDDPERAGQLLNDGYAYFSSVIVHWLQGSGDSATVPTAAAGKPLVLVLKNDDIRAGSKVFMNVGGTVTEVATATIDGEVSIEFYEDPEFIVAATVPDAPTAVSATGLGELATVSWTAPASDGGSDIVSYTVTSSGGQSCTTTSTSCTVAGLTVGTSYTFSVVATNGIGDSAPGTTAQALTTTPSSYEVTFDSNGGSAVASSTFPVGGSVLSPGSPSRSGFNFAGWSTVLDDADTKVTFPYAPGVDANITLYALWTEVISSGGGTSTTPSGPASGLDAVSGKTWVWTKRLSKNEVKVYIKFPEMGANYQIRLQKNDGDYARKMSKTINTTSDTDLRVVGEWYYLVRTITLPGEGRYRIEVTQDGQRVTLNGQDRPAVYSYR